MGPLPQIFTLGDFPFEILLQKLRFCIKHPSKKLAGKAFQISVSDILRKENVDKKVPKTWKRYLCQSIKETQKHKSCYGDCSEYWDGRESKASKWKTRGVLQTMKLSTKKPMWSKVSKTKKNVINIQLIPNHNMYRENALEKGCLRTLACLALCPPHKEGLKYISREVSRLRRLKPNFISLNTFLF